jgi:phenol hydroxylase P2 protein
VSNVSITLIASGDARPLVEAIRADNPGSTVLNLPSVIKIDCPDRLVVNAESVSDRIGRPWETQELHMSLVSISGNIEQDDDRIVLSWRA